MQTKGLYFTSLSNHSSINQKFFEGGRLQELIILAPNVTFANVEADPYWAEFYTSDKSLTITVNDNTYDFSNCINFFSYTQAKPDSYSKLIFTNNSVLLYQNVSKLDIYSNTYYYYNNGKIIFPDFLPNNCESILDSNLGAFFTKENTNLVCEIPGYTEEQYVGFMNGINSALHPEVFIGITPQITDVTSIFYSVFECFNPQKAGDNITITVSDQELNNFKVIGKFVIHPFFNHIKNNKLTYVNNDSSQSVNILTSNVSSIINGEELTINIEQEVQNGN